MAPRPPLAVPWLGVWSPGPPPWPAPSPTSPSGSNDAQVCASWLLARICDPLRMGCRDPMASSDLLLQHLDCDNGAAAAHGQPRSTATGAGQMGAMGEHKRPSSSRQLRHRRAPLCPSPPAAETSLCLSCVAASGVGGDSVVRTTWVPLPFLI